MSERLHSLKSSPIIEAVLDIDCDMPPALALDKLEASARDAFRSHYKKVRTQFVQAMQVEAAANQAPNVTTRQAIQALQFLQEDEKQLVQVRTQGFSFNRLAPYTKLDDYLPEMERTWRLFVGLAAPVQIRTIRLRYINRILLPLTEGRVELDEYLKLGPRLPDEDKLTFTGFLNQHSALEADTGNQVNMVLTTQPQEADRLPVIFDIEAFKSDSYDPLDWDTIHLQILSLRRLKNVVFENSLTDKCLNLFQH